MGAVITIHALSHQASYRRLLTESGSRGRVRAVSDRLNQANSRNN